MAEQKTAPDTAAPESHAGEMLAALAFQLEAGADECIDAIPAAMQIPDIAPPQMREKGSEKGNGKAMSAPAPAMVSPDMEGISGLPELAEACAGFDCELRRTATNMVFAAGNPDSRIMLIGEAPGADEDRQGTPFAGASGRLLDRMLASIGLDRDRVYLTNILNWRPPGNRTPTAEEIALFRPLIKKHIALAAPEVIFALGGVAAKALLEVETGILKLRGHWHEYDAGGEKMIPLLASLHPDSLLANPGQKQLAWHDLRMLREKILAGALAGALMGAVENAAAK